MTIIQPIPGFIDARRICCRICPAATRSTVDGRRGVSLRDQCTAAPVPITIERAISDPGFECPRKHFGKAEGVLGTLIVEGGRMIGWRQGVGCGGC